MSMTPPRTLRDVAAALGLEPPAQDLPIAALNTVDEAGPDELTFLANDRYALRLKSSRAGAALVPADFAGEAPMPLLRTPRPRIAFAQLLALFHPPRARRTGRHPTAIVAESASVGANVGLGAYVVVGENVRIGDGTTLHPHVVVYDDVTIGKDCEIHSHVSLREGISLGDRVSVHNGTVIGADGFGFEPDERGHLLKVPQVGTVRIDDDVEIQANSCVDRAALGATIVGTGTKIDNLAQIAHGCVVGKHAVICGQVGLAGSSIVGDHAMMGGQSASAGHIVIGARAKVAAQSGAMFDVPDGTEVGGSPAIPVKDALRAALFLPQLPDIARRLKKLERAFAKDQDA
ncbi:MAG: UDP-3-O-(3-hydroxymyristoyl)glucosamine N-acyltransferase [Planctomycetota bacterium]|nr:UDP-3-O-(3-hydroxymyristoyl)glucosamine N-acyltransferase [Planctomycetota bacterium]